MEHLDCRAVDPPGSDPRRWKCLDCGLVMESLTLLHKDRSCTGPRKDQDTRLIDAIEGRE